MHRSIWDSDVEAVFEEARVAGVSAIVAPPEVAESVMNQCVESEETDATK